MNPRLPPDLSPLPRGTLRADDRRVLFRPLRRRRDVHDARDLVNHPVRVERGRRVPDAGADGPPIRAYA